MNTIWYQFNGWASSNEGENVFKIENLPKKTRCFYFSIIPDIKHGKASQTYIQPLYLGFAVMFLCLIY